MPGKFSLEFDIHQAAMLGMGTRKEIKANHSYKEILTWVLFGVYEAACVNKQYEK